jgi:hypothetical protein
MLTANTGKWAELLNAFHGLIESNPEPAKVKNKLLFEGKLTI